MYRGYNFSLTISLCLDAPTWPFRKRTDGTPKTSKAIAYLKASVPESDTAPTIELSRADSPVMKTLNDDLLVAYVVNTGDSFSYVQYRDLETDSVSEAELHEIGLRNLAAFADSGNLRVVPHGNIFAVLLNGNFEASMILLDQLWTESLREFVSGDFLVATPARDILAFCDASSTTGRTELMQVIDRLKASQDHPLTQQLYVRRGRNWVPESAA